MKRLGFLVERPAAAAAIAMAVACIACSGSTGRNQGERLILSAAWDTTLVLGSDRVDDTVLIDPWRLAAWDDRVAVLESKVNQVRVFSLSGTLLWAYGHTGQGPGEIGSAEEIFVLPDDDLGVWDGRNRKVLRLSKDGQFLGETYFRELWGVSTNPTPVGDHFLWNQLASDRPMMVSASTRASLADSVRVDWPVPSSLPYPPELAGFMDSDGSSWVVGLWVGPYFAVGHGDSVAVHRYAGHHTFAYAQGSWRRSDPLADSAYYGARDVVMAGGHVFFLSGGRPRRRAHDEEPTRYIDEYLLDGRYEGSYELPFDCWAIATLDGHTFFAATNVDGAYPHVYGLRPRTGAN